MLDLVYDSLAFGRFRVEAQPIVELENDEVEAEEGVLNVEVPEYLEEDEENEQDNSNRASKDRISKFEPSQKRLKTMDVHPVE